MEWGTVPQWVEAMGIWFLVIEVYQRWKHDPDRPTPMLNDE